MKPGSRSEEWRRRSRNRTLQTAALVLTLVAVLAPEATAGAEPGRAAAGDTYVACTRGPHRTYVGLAHPRRCTFGGYRGAGRDFVRGAVGRMSWGHWGAKPTRTVGAVETDTGRPVQIIAYRRVTCRDGSSWYSQLIVLHIPTGEFFKLRELPTCRQGP